MTQPLAIISALPQELHLLRADLQDEETLDFGGAARAWRGTLDGRPVVLAESGIGKVAAAMLAALVIGSARPRAVLFSGVAGGLDPGLAIGDVVIASRLVQHDFGIAGARGMTVYQAGHLPFFNPTDELGYAPRAEVLAKALGRARTVALAPVMPGHPRPRVVSGTILTGDAFVDSVALRDQMRREFDAAAVEMEGAAVAQVARAFGLECLVVRAVSDLAGAEASSPDYFARFLDRAAGNSARVVRALLTVF